MEREDIYGAVVKRAVGYEARETVEEYAMVDGALELVKKRITVKDVPPDMTAAKMLFDEGGLSSLTDEQLEAERRRLLLELKAEEAASAALGAAEQAAPAAANSTKPVGGQNQKGK